MDALEQTLRENIEYFRLQERQALATLAGLPRGSIKTRSSRGRSYYYLQFRHQGEVVQRYLGRSFPVELAEQIEKRKATRTALREIRRSLKLLRQRQSDNLLEPVAEILRALSREGLWEAGAEIVGSWCFRIYQEFLGVSAYPLRTDDLDILVPIPWRGRRVDLAELLRRMGFAERFLPDASTSYHRPGLRVEFLTGARGRGSEWGVVANGLGVNAQSLRFMEMLLESPMPIKIMAGVTVTVPAPAVFVFHKLLVSLRRTRADKRSKDLAQAIAVARFLLEDRGRRRPLREAWERLLPSWRKQVRKAIEAGRTVHPLEEGVLDALAALAGER